MACVRQVRRGLVAGGLSAMVALVAGCASDPAGPAASDGPPARLEALPRPLTTAERTAVTAGTDFTLGLFREVNRRKSGENVFISPLSAAVALAMTAQGAAGTTEVAMRGTLGFPTQTLATMGEGYRGLFALLLSLDSSVTLRSAMASRSSPRSSTRRANCSAPTSAARTSTTSRARSARSTAGRRRRRTARSRRCSTRSRATT